MNLNFWFFTLFFIIQKLINLWSSWTAGAGAAPLALLRPKKWRLRSTDPIFTWLEMSRLPDDWSSWAAVLLKTDRLAGFCTISASWTYDRNFGSGSSNFKKLLFPIPLKYFNHLIGIDTDITMLRKKQSNLLVFYSNFVYFFILI